MRRLTYSGSPRLTLTSMVAAVVFLSPTVAPSQTPEWMNFTSGADVCALADDGDYLWVGGGGLTKLNKATGEMAFYNSANSGLPDNAVHSLGVDSRGDLWIGTEGGLAKFDGESWEVYDTGNSGLPGNWVWSLALDAQGDLWIGTSEDGLARFDGENWQGYRSWNSGLPDNCVSSLAFDAQGNLWIGTEGGLAKFDGDNCRCMTRPTPDCRVTRSALLL